MIKKLLGEQRAALLVPLLSGALALVAAPALLPSAQEMAAASRRALAKLQGPARVSGAALAAVPNTVRHQSALRRFQSGETLPETELRELLASSIGQADAETLSRIADRLDDRFPDATTQVTWALLAKNRPVVAAAFFETRADRESAPLWPLRVETHRRAGNVAFASDLLRSAATHPGSAPARDFIAAAYALKCIPLLLVAAEHGSIPRLDRIATLDVAHWANHTKHFEVFARIDRVGDPGWRNADPWLAMSLAQRSGDIAAALRYAQLLPSGREEARDALILASGDRDAIRSLLMTRVASDSAQLPRVSEQLLRLGFRSDAEALLRSASADKSPRDPVAQRLLYLMGPRPDAQNLSWLQNMARHSAQWRSLYLERVPPKSALAFVQAQGTGTETDGLLLQLKLADEANNVGASAKLLNRLLDGRRLTRDELSEIAIRVPAELSDIFSSRLSEARVAAGAASASDRISLAWASWNRGDANVASEQLDAFLRSKPDDVDALRLMADVQAKLHGKKAQDKWLSLALENARPNSTERALILEQLGRNDEALQVLEKLRRASPGDRRLAVIQARVLVAAGNPGRARKVLQP